MTDLKEGQQVTMLINYFGELYLNMAKEKSFPVIQLKAVFMNACFYIKHKQHLAPNASKAKQRVCDAMGLPKNTPYNEFAYALAVQLDMGGHSEFVRDYLKRMGLKGSTNKQGYYVLVEK